MRLPRFPWSTTVAERIERRAHSQQGNLAAALKELSRLRFRTAREARAAGRVIASFAAEPGCYTLHSSAGSPLHDCAAILQWAKSKEAAWEFRKQGLPQLRVLFDRCLAEWCQQAPVHGLDRLGDDLLFVLKIFAIYGGEEQVDRIAAAMRLPLAPQGYLWSLVLEAADRSGAGLALANALGRLVPSAFMGVAYADLLNSLAWRGELAVHPFDCPEGHERLRQWLQDLDPEHSSYAVSATSALAFLEETARVPLMALANAHSAADVRLEAARVRAALKDEAGVGHLAALATDPRYASTASKYLQELGRQDTLPSEVGDPDFDSMATMCDWLAHPGEFGRPPDAIDLLDTRRLFWPPTNDERQLWLLKYRYGADEGVGLVGSITFSLGSETSAVQNPEDVYAIHCCWELQWNNDPRAPKERSVSAGRRLLRLA